MIRSAAAVLGLVLGLLVPAASRAAESPPAAKAAQSAVIIMYHRFGEGKYPTTSITLETIDAHIRELTNGRYTVWPLKRIVEAVRAGETLPERTVGISINRWQPTNVLRALDTGLIDAVQVVYNVFDQNPEDELFPACLEKGVAVIARVPLDEGSLTGTLTADSRWPEGDFRNFYFKPENLEPTLDRVERLRPVVPPDMTMPEMTLRHILMHPAISTVIPGMRKLRHVEQNIGASGRPLSADLMAELRRHRWDRTTDFE